MKELYDIAIDHLSRLWFIYWLMAAVIIIIVEMIIVKLSDREKKQ